MKHAQCLQQIGTLERRTLREQCLTDDRNAETCRIEGNRGCGGHVVDRRSGRRHSGSKVQRDCYNTNRNPNATTPSMSSPSARAEARRKAILARGSDRLSKLTSSARGDDPVYAQNGRQVHALQKLSTLSHECRSCITQ